MQILTVLFGVLNVSFMTYVILQIRRKEDVINEVCDFIAEKATQDKEFQDKLYYIGGILGTGFAKGFGIQKGSGKRGMIDFFIDMISKPQQAQTTRKIGDTQL